MPNKINIQQLEQYQKAITKGGVPAAIKVYEELYDQGYNYAGWAKGRAFS